MSDDFLLSDDELEELSQGELAEYESILAGELEDRRPWTEVARLEQLPPDGPWNVWLYQAGRGAGKSRAAAEDMARYGLAHPGARLAVVANTFSDARDTCVEGESGILACLPERQVKLWNRSIGELFLVNGARYKLFSADEPDRLRGPQHHRAWCDELAHFRYPETWDMLMMGLRLGTHPQCVVTTTPKPTALLRSLHARDDVAVTRGTTWDNAANLAPAALESLRRRYEGTRLGRQELLGELVEDVEGALWHRSWIEDHRVDGPPYAGFQSVVVGLDPADGTAEGAEQALVVAGVGLDRQFYVLHTEGMRETPLEWLTRAIKVARDFAATRLVVEKNFGGRALLEVLEQAFDRAGTRIAYRVVTATTGKLTRAEPVAALYEQGRVSHVGAHPELEEQLIGFTAAPGEKSPDRLDAAVHAITDLMGYGMHRGHESNAVASYTEQVTDPAVVAWC